MGAASPTDPWKPKGRDSDAAQSGAVQRFAAVIRGRSHSATVSDMTKGAVEISSSEYAPAQCNRPGPFKYEEAGGRTHSSIRATGYAMKC